MAPVATGRREPSAGPRGRSFRPSRPAAPAGASGPWCKSPRPPTRGAGLRGVPPNQVTRPPPRAIRDLCASHDWRRRRMQLSGWRTSSETFAQSGARSTCDTVENFELARPVHIRSSGAVPWVPRDSVRTATYPETCELRRPESRLWRRSGAPQQERQSAAIDGEGATFEGPHPSAAGRSRAPMTQSGDFETPHAERRQTAVRARREPRAATSNRPIPTTAGRSPRNDTERTTVSNDSSKRPQEIVRAAGTNPRTSPLERQNLG
jgi:hypothetical protein